MTDGGSEAEVINPTLSTMLVLPMLRMFEYQDCHHRMKRLAENQGLTSVLTQRPLSASVYPFAHRRMELALNSAREETGPFSVLACPAFIFFISTCGRASLFSFPPCLSFVLALFSPVLRPRHISVSNVGLLGRRPICEARINSQQHDSTRNLLPSWGSRKAWVI